MLVENANLYAQDKEAEGVGSRAWKEVTGVEMRCWVGIQIYMDVVKLPANFVI